MPKKTSKSGSELFIVDNSDEDWKAVRYLHDWCQLSKTVDIATGYFEIGSLLALDGEWQKLDAIRILMGDEVSRRTHSAFADGLRKAAVKLDDSLDAEKTKNDFLRGVPSIVEAIRSGRIRCRVYRKDKFHAKAYITHARLEVVGSSALVGSSNFTYPGLTENVELNIQITGQPVNVLQEWYDEHWDAAEDVSDEILRVIERHTREYSPFEVYAKALQEFFRGHELTDDEWEKQQSKIYPILDQYQREGYHAMLKRAGRYKGAFLCDGVGLGKTFIGLMLIERLVEFDRKRVALIVPKSGRKPVWEKELKRYLPHIFGAYSNLLIFNHTDLTRGGDFPAQMTRVKEMADVVIIDEAHHFRNTGIKGKVGEIKSRYWKLFDLVAGKDLHLLTATPVNNRLTDLQHLIELFSQRQADYFKDAPLGIHSLPGHFRKMEKDLEQAILKQHLDSDGLETNQAEAAQVLANDGLFRSLVVQRSRAYVKQSQIQSGSPLTLFPKREPPKVAKYSIKKTYGKLLDLLEKAFSKEKPLFALAIYYPLAYYKGPDSSIQPLEQGRQREVVSLIRIQFLKRFESSARSFEMSCQTLLLKLLAWAKKHSQTDAEKRRLERWVAHGSAMLADVTELAAEDLPEADAWVAGFPCQPFSSSGNRLGFGHRSGNVFEHLTRLMESRLPPLVVFENVEGLLTNKSGHTFAVVLAKLTGLGYAVSWLLVDLLMFGTPQTRPRLFLVAAQAKVLLSKELQEANGLLPGMGNNYSNAFADFLETRGMPWVERSRGRLEQLEQLLRPAVGKARIEQKAAFGSLGHASDGHYVSFDVDAPLMPKVAPSLRQLVAPHFSKAGDIRSGRYYARGGPTTLCLRSELISHCIGTSLGGAPLYAVPLSSVENASDRAAFLEFSNWHREQDGVLVMRLRPDRAVMLFGPHTEALHKAVTEWDAGDTRKYKVVGNMVAPVCAKAVADLINEQLLEWPRPTSFTPVRPVVSGKETSRKSSLDHAATP